ncbi:Protein male abnormal 21 [Toxocara canis]|uniref:Protein male abnormal 21 n=1 Tax=Toxocara canis TaxID=6265 RepID=A0A0B2URN7_TOXCA|nr:Protein male abnormal 21 [Toxocara canis]
MLGQNSAVTVYQISHYFNERVAARKSHVHKAVHMVAKIVQEILKEVETQEPRFISTLINSNGRYEGVMVHSPCEYEVILYLNQMGVFNFVDDGSIQGCAVLKLSDGRKRSMSLWVEFITASGYLSARKIRSRFQTLVGQAVEKSQYRDICKLLTDTSDVKLRIHDKYIVQITCAFRCNGIWPRSASQWPSSSIPWPNPSAANDVKNEGFDLFSKETNTAQTQPNKQASSMEGDAWAMSLNQAENALLQHGARRKTFSILKCLRDTHLDFPSSPITNYILKTLLLFECEKHYNEFEWEERFIGDRVIGVLLQLVSCLQCRKCPHYFLPQLDLLKGKPNHLLDQSAKITWNLVRQLMLNARALETL